MALHPDSFLFELLYSSGYMHRIVDELSLLSYTWHQAIRRLARQDDAIAYQFYTDGFREDDWFYAGDTVFLLLQNFSVFLCRDDRYGWTQKATVTVDCLRVMRSDTKYDVFKVFGHAGLRFLKCGPPPYPIDWPTVDESLCDYRLFVRRWNLVQDTPLWHSTWHDPRHNEIVSFHGPRKRRAFDTLHDSDISETEDLCTKCFLDDCPGAWGDVCTRCTCDSPRSDCEWCYEENKLMSP